MYENIDYIIYNMLNVVIIYKSIKKIMTKELTYNRKIEICSYMIFYILVSYTFLKFGIPLLMLITNLLGLFLIQFNYKTNTKDKLLLAIYIIVILSIIDILVLIITKNIIMPINIKSNYESIIGWTLQLITSYCLLKSLKNFDNIKFLLNIPNIFWIPLIIIPIISILLIIFLLFIGRENINIILIVFLGFIIINITLFVLYKYIIDYIKNKMEIEFYDKQIKAMKSNYESLEILRHDLQKHLKFLNILLEENKIEDVKRYLKDISSPIIIDKKFNINSGNIIIDSILNFKLQEILNNNIKLEYNVLLPNNLILNEFDMVCLLENLIDNIIEANLKISNIEERYAFINIEYKKNALKIVTQNNYDSINLDGKNNIITSKKDILNHGIGLKSIKKIVNKYYGKLNINVEDRKFEIEIILFNIKH